MSISTNHVVSIYNTISLWNKGPNQIKIHHEKGSQTRES